MRLVKLKEQFAKLSPETRLYELKIPIVALTGGIACGKTTVSKKFKNLEAPIISADELVKEIYNTDEAKKFIQYVCPSAIVDGKIHFQNLRVAVFDNEELKEKIQDFIYPKLKKYFLQAVPPSAEFVLYDVPLLFERHLEGLVDCNILVYCPRLVQETRLMERDGITPELVEKMLSSQMDIEEKKKKAQFVLDNSSSVEQLETNIQRLTLEMWHIR